ncbi:GMP synthase-like glutamine amidotransferase [Chitinivorax tropicus]|uniref:GMP synthase-like glutamine amidotransferase n=1 Tax=Chitinivorax tropicus TaxID=714531 RepID=A0A840MLJ4_9PROT|nr:type 1 glutamine amidotransferase [Chitinivorax tropicus]MBB5019280.1 GMP synthase-like glutamine amidotransferase [Chitinivorax tropicus]
MKPILITQHIAADGPGHLAVHLSRHQLPYQICRLFAGDVLPTDATAFSGLAILGGPMSVNDKLPWIAQELALIGHAVSQRVPVIGHCLGGQLLSKALGGVVTASPHVEIGWSDIQPANPAVCRDWFGGANPALLFQWHNETFSLPTGAELLAIGRHCPNQAYLVDGLHLGMQFHCEVDAAKVMGWVDTCQADIAAAAHSPGVQSAAGIKASLARLLPISNRLAEAIYDRWLQGIRRP